MLVVQWLLLLLLVLLQMPLLQLMLLPQLSLLDLHLSKRRVLLLVFSSLL